MNLIASKIITINFTHILSMFLLLEIFFQIIPLLRILKKHIITYFLILILAFNSLNPPINHLLPHRRQTASSSLPSRIYLKVTHVQDLIQSSHIIIILLLRSLFLLLALQIRKSKAFDCILVHIIYMYIPNTLNVMFIFNETIIR